MEVEDVKKRKMAVLFLLALLLVAGISPIFDDIAEIFVDLLDAYQGEISTAYDGDGGGGGQPNGGGGGS
jgi:hypothetical protein